MNWTYDPNQTGMPVVDTATGERVCNVDCADFYEIGDYDEDKLAEYEARRDSNGRLIAAAPAMLEILRVLQEAVERGDENLNPIMCAVDDVLKRIGE